VPSATESRTRRARLRLKQVVAILACLKPMTISDGFGEKNKVTFLLIIGIALLVLWTVGIGTRTTAGGLLHVVLLIAVVLIAFYLLRAVFGVI